MGLFRNLRGKKFGKWIVMRQAGWNRWRQSLWLCVCKCGNKSIVSGTALIYGSSRHCIDCRKVYKGKKSPKYVHGGHTTHKREYHSWAAARYRCNNASSNSWEYYGGRGIRMCAGWNATTIGFINFLADMGRRPRNKSLDRIDVNGNYSCGHCAECVAHSWPANCRWATAEVQNANRRMTVEEAEEFRKLADDLQAEYDEMHPY